MTRTSLNKRSNEKVLEEIKSLFSFKKNDIRKRLVDFKKVRLKKNSDIFAELVFCLLTPQSKAKTCWSCVVQLKKKSLLQYGTAGQIINELKGVRFKNKKAIYIVNARQFFTKDSRNIIKSKLKKIREVNRLRDWLVENVKGMGYKEASHFLRNIGLGENLAILDRHILKNLKLAGIVSEIPDSLGKRRYFEIEKKMLKFAEKIKIPIDYLDLLLWYKEAGEVFK